MRYAWLVWAALARKPLRSTLTVLAIAVAFLLFGVLKGFTLAFDSLVADVPAYRLDVFRRSASLGGGLPFAHVATIKSIPGIKEVTYLEGVRALYRDPSDGFFLLAVDIDGLRRIDSGINVTDDALARFRANPIAALVGRELATEQHWQIGDRVTFNLPEAPRRDRSTAWTFDVAGIWIADDTTPSRQIFIHYDYFDNERAQRNGLVSEISVAVDDTSSPAEVATRIDQTFVNSSTPTRTTTSRDGVRMSMQRLGDVEFFVNAIVGSSLFAILFVAGGTLMQSVRERTPELAVLRTIGFERRTTVGLLVGEALTLTLSGALLGVTLARVVAPTIFYAMLRATLPLPWTLYAYAASAAALVAFVAVAFPAARAYRISVVDALAGR